MTHAGNRGQSLVVPCLFRRTPRKAISSGRLAARPLALLIADNEGGCDARLFPFGRGTVDWHDVVSALRETRRPALFNFEIPGENRCPLPARLATGLLPRRPAATAGSGRARCATRPTLPRLPEGAESDRLLLFQEVESRTSKRP